MATVQGQGGIHGIFSAFTQATTGRTAAQAERNKAREMSVCRKEIGRASCRERVYVLV